VQILSAGARLLMADNQSKKISEIMEQLNALDTGMKEGEYERILIGRGGVLDPQKWGKAFDSRELRKKTVSAESALAAENAIAYRKRNGWVDKADIEVTKNINGRKAWVMKDGRVIYADEYEQQ
jgi:hypothetical protein